MAESRVNLYTDEFDKLINDRGNNAEWEQAMVCSCVSRDSGQPRFDCPICGGSGYRYLTPRKIVVAVSSLNGSIKQETLQLYEPGTCYITPKSNIIMGYRDRLRFTDFRCKFSEVIKWDAESAAKGVSPRTYRDIREVLMVCDDSYEYEEGVDFDVSDDMYHLIWRNKSVDLTSARMSILYLTTPSYLVNDLLHELRGTISDRKHPSATYEELPKQYRCSREDFIYNVADPDNDRYKSSSDSSSSASSGTSTSTSSYSDTISV